MSTGANLDISGLLNPLDENQIAGLRTQVLQYPLVKDAILKAQQAGIDVTEQLKVLDEEYEKALKLLEVYGK